MGWVLVFLFLFSFFFLFMVLAPFLLQWNMRNLFANGDLFRSTSALKASVICLQETFLTPSDDVSLPSWFVYRADRSHACGGGLLTAVCASLPSFRLHLSPCSDPSFEALGGLSFRR